MYRSIGDLPTGISNFETNTVVPRSARGSQSSPTRRRRSDPEAPMRLPRFTTRRLMVLVAVAAMALCGWQLRERRAFCLQRAGFMEACANALEGAARHDPRNAVAYEAKAEDYRGRAVRFRHAACYPWLPVPPDPDIAGGINR